MTGEQGLEVKVIFFAAQSVRDDTAQSGFMGVGEVRQCRRRSTEVCAGTGKRNESVFAYLLAGELFGCQ
ncbi:hypothetical protein D3C73_1280550 [compost metagenome]